MSRYFLIEDNGNVTKTDNRAAAIEASKGVGSNGYAAVIDAHHSTEIINGKETGICEQTQFQIS